MIIVKYIYAYILIHSIDLWIKSLICDVMRRKVYTGHARWPFLAHPTLKAIFAESHAELWLTVSSRRETCNFQGHNGQCWSMHATFTPCSDIQLAYCYSQISLIAGVKEPQRVSRCRVCRGHFDARWQYRICFDGWEAQSEWSSRCHQNQNHRILSWLWVFICWGVEGILHFSEATLGCCLSILPALCQLPWSKCISQLKQGKRIKCSSYR